MSEGPACLIYFFGFSLTSLFIWSLGEEPWDRNRLGKVPQFVAVFVALFAAGSLLCAIFGEW